MDPDLEEPRASIWGMDNPTTQIATSAFVQKFLPRFLERSAEALDELAAEIDGADLSDDDGTRTRRTRIRAATARAKRLLLGIIPAPRADAETPIASDIITCDILLPISYNFRSHVSPRRFPATRDPTPTMVLLTASRDGAGGSGTPESGPRG